MLQLMMKLWDRGEQTLAGALGLGALALGLWQAVSRYFFPQHAISFAEEVIVYLMIWAVMVVSSQLVRTDSHVRPDLVLNVASPVVKRWLAVFNSLAAIVFCAALVFYGWQIVETALLIDERSSSSLRFPMWVYYAALPVGSALMLMRYGIRLVGLVATRDWDALLPDRPGAHELRPDSRQGK